jgi:anti-sigma B factor antagonist
MCLRAPGRRWLNHSIDVMGTVVAMRDGGQVVGEAEGLRGPPVAGIEKRDGAVIVELVGELDLYNAHLLREQLFAAAKEAPERLIVALSGVTFIDSTGLGVLIEARTILANRRAFLLVGPGLETKRALEISGLDRHFAVYDSLDEALAATL